MVSRGTPEACHGAPPHIRRRASSGRLTCHGTSTCARGRGRSGPRSGKGGCSSSFHGGPLVGDDRSTPAGRKSAAKKTLGGVTTRGRNSRIGRRLRGRLGLRAARALFSGMLGFRFRCAAPLGLAALGLPAADQTQALWVLAVELIPAFRLVPLAATLAQAHPPTRFSPAGLGTCFSSRLGGAHGSSHLPRLSPRKSGNSSSGVFVQERKPRSFSLPPPRNQTRRTRQGERDKEGNSFEIARRKETR
jgi:hypothetical protein